MIKKKWIAFTVACQVWLDHNGTLGKAYDAYVFSYTAQTTGARRAKGQLSRQK